MLRKIRLPVASRALVRWISDTQEPGSVEGIRALIQQAERERAEKELAVDTRRVVFAGASSADHRPRIAAAEAFDVAAAALPQPPNFCYMNVSVDYEAMMDAPEVVWFNLCRANNVPPSSAPLGSVHMLGGAVRHQRLGGGYIQLVLGCIPDLEADFFTFDTVPEAAEIHDATRAPPAVCFASLDTKLALRYEQVLSARINTLAQRLGKSCPLVGGIYPPIAAAPEEKESAPDITDFTDSAFFFNDRIYKGSAAAVILRSRLVKANAVSVVPSICVGSGTVDDVTSEVGVYVIRRINGETATDFIRHLYMSDDLREKTCKVFLGVTHNAAHVPVTFIGNPENGTIACTPPPGLSLKSGDVVDFLVDDVELDTETAAGLLIGMEKSAAPIAVEKDITIAQEARKNVVASSCAAFHFSHNGLNVVAQPDVPVISLGNANLVFSPSILQRCVGRSCPNAGFFCSGQVATIDDVTAIFPRSSTFCFLEGVS